MTQELLTTLEAERRIRRLIARYGEVAMITASYEDDYVRRGETWYFHRRRFTLRSRTVLAHSQTK